LFQGEDGLLDVAQLQTKLRDDSRHIHEFALGLPFLRDPLAQAMGVPPIPALRSRAVTPMLDQAHHGSLTCHRARTDPLALVHSARRCPCGEPTVAS
jgi:hypothetical protein